MGRFLNSTGNIVVGLMLLVLIVPVALASKTHEIGQKDKKFVNNKMEEVVEIQVQPGDKIKFVNHDAYFHNIFSLSDAKSFDLGSFPKGEHREITIDKKGTIEVECALHPDMLLKIESK